MEPSRSATLRRREFLKSALATSTLAAFQRAHPVAAPRPAATQDLIDVNVSLSRWPLRRLRGDDPASLVALLKSRGITQAWAGSLDALLHKDLGAVNARLADECRRHGRGLLLPFGSVNPKAPDWTEELRRCAEEHGMRGIRLFPNYHGYALNDPHFVLCLREAAAKGLIVQLAVIMEDERMMHPLLRVEPVDTSPLPDLIKGIPKLRLVLLNVFRTLRGEPLLRLVASGAVYLEISMLEGVGGVGQLLAQVPSNRVLFGSHAPFFYVDSALLKLQESPLSAQQLMAIRHGNARQLLKLNRNEPANHRERPS